jgi:branched-chain amino acid transport system substrate-binding protein
MSDKLTIGVLLTNSTILPMAANFNSGLKLGLNGLSSESGLEVEIVPEFVGQGSKEHIETAINKLIGFNNSDVITGIISNKVSSELADKFARCRRPLIINNIGEHLPDPSGYGDYLFLNSVHTWQQVWSMGKWAAETLGKRGMFVSGLYDSGYSFPVMLQKGMESTGADTSLSYAVAPVRQYKGLADVASVIPYLIQDNPDFVFAAFCGEEASIFLSEYIKHGVHRKIPLLGLPFLLAPFDSNGEQIEIYTTLSAYREISHDEITRLSNTASDPFSQFGYETGLIIKNAVKSSPGTTLQRALAEIAINAERGKLEILPHNTGNTGRVFLVKNTWCGNKDEMSSELITELETIGINDKVIAEINNQPSSGWLNPYLSI